MKDRWSQQNSWLIVCSNKVMSPHLLKIRLKNQSSSNLSRIHRSPADQIDIIIGLLYCCAHRMSIKITIFNANQSGACGPGLNCVQELSQPPNNNWCIAQRTLPDMRWSKGGEWMRFTFLANMSDRLQMTNSFLTRHKSENQLGKYVLYTEMCVEKSSHWDIARQISH